MSCLVPSGFKVSAGVLILSSGDVDDVSGHVFILNRNIYNKVIYLKSWRRRPSDPLGTQRGRNRGGTEILRRPRGHSRSRTLDEAAFPPLQRRTQQLRLAEVPPCDKGSPGRRSDGDARRRDMVSHA